MTVDGCVNHIMWQRGSTSIIQHIGRLILNTCICFNFTLILSLYWGGHRIWLCLQCAETEASLPAKHRIVPRGYRDIRQCSLLDDAVVEAYHYWEDSQQLSLYCAQIFSCQLPRDVMIMFALLNVNIRYDHLRVNDKRRYDHVLLAERPVSLWSRPLLYHIYVMITLCIII